MMAGVGSVGADFATLRESDKRVMNVVVAVMRVSDRDGDSCADDGDVMVMVLVVMSMVLLVMVVVEKWTREEEKRD